MSGPIVCLGLPEHTGRLPHAALTLTPDVLYSAGRMWRDGRLRTPGRAVWMGHSRLDSAGFVAIMQGGYRWSVHEYVDFVVTNGGDGSMPFPWVWWSTMDYCCEPEIAKNRAEIGRRIDLTIQSYADTLDALAEWWSEGAHTPRPMPILQGRQPADYLRCFRGLEAVWSTRPLMEWEEADREAGELDESFPSLVGIGSVCRRQLRGPDGLLRILDVLDKELPPHVRLHLFGVKGGAMPFLRLFGHRVKSVDSQAWDAAARQDAGQQRKRVGGLNVSDPSYIPCSIEHRIAHMERWFMAQMDGAFEHASYQQELW